MTLNREKELVDHLVNKIKDQVSQNVQVIAASDFTEERKDYVVVVGINNTVQAHPFVPAYQYNLEIIVDCFIDSDKEGYIYNQVKDQILGYLEPYIMDKNKLGELFDPIPIVGFFLEGVSNSTTDQSNKAIIGFRVVASYPF